MPLNDVQKGYLIALATVNIIILLIALIMNLTGKKSKIRISVLSVMIFINMIYWAAAVEFGSVFPNYEGNSFSSAAQFVASIPFSVQMLWDAASIFFAIYSTYMAYKINRNSINKFSIKEALENLPSGIAFMSDDLGLYLSNNIIRKLCKELTGKPLQNANVFWADLLKLSDENICVIKGEAPAFILKNGEVWQFSKTSVSLQDSGSYQIIGSDITELYNLSGNADRVNEKLFEQQERLKKINDIVEKNAQEEVTVNMKINFHDNFGNLLTLTKKTLRENADIDAARAVAKYWDDLGSVITDLSSDGNTYLNLEQIILFGDKLGCKVFVNGEVPKDDKCKEITLLCINEMLKNAYRHAQAEKLMVDIIEANKSVVIKIHNEDKLYREKIEEGGGLLGLRQKIEHVGGKMDMTCNDGVTMTVVLYKENVEGILCVK